MNRYTDKTFEQYFTDLFGELKLQIVSENDDFIIAQPNEDLLKYYLKGIIKPIIFDATRQETITSQKYVKTIYSHEREPGHQYGDLKFECEKIIVSIPIESNGGYDLINRLRTSSFSSSPDPTFIINQTDITFEVEIEGYGLNLNNEQTANSINSTKTTIKNLIESKNSEINSLNNQLKVNLANFIKERKEKLDLDNKRLNELVKLVNIPLKRKDNEIVKNINIDRKPFVAKIKPQTPDEDYKLDRIKVLDIIKLISNQCLQFEKTPKTYEKFDEPNLRDLILANLNSIFEGQATGETFNNKGKTDIYLNIDKGNILVAECKIYNGQKLYHDTINQLLGYLTWRQNYGIIISFCKNKNFTKILEDAKSIITSHSSYDSAFDKQNNAHFISKHTLPIDDYKYVEIHHLFYNLYNQ